VSGGENSGHSVPISRHFPEDWTTEDVRPHAGGGSSDFSRASRRGHMTAQPTVG